MIKSFLRKIRALAYQGKAARNLSPDLEPAFLSIYRECSPYTMTSLERMYALYGACAYVSANRIEGDIVECGVWRGGSSMLMAHSLKRLGDESRKIYLYDTFKGMTRPGGEDSAKEREKWARNDAGTHNAWAYAPKEEVEKNMGATSYPKEKIILVEGEVEKTIPGAAPEKISLLRLDTDWFESTYHELTYLFPRLTKGGVLILDDYGSKQGARRAVDKYFSEHGLHPFLMRIDATGRLLIK